jgi:hypothetical protein
MLYEGADSPLEAEVISLPPLALVDERDRDPSVEEGELSEAGAEDVEAEFILLRKNLDVRAEADRGPGLVTVPDPLKGREGLSARVLLTVEASVTVNLERHLVGERVDTGDTDPMEAAGDFIRVVIELSSCVEDGHDDLRGAPPLGVHPNGDPAPIIGHRARTILKEDHGDLITIARERLIDRVIDRLIDELVEAGPVIRVTDVHPRALPDRFEAFQDPNALRAISLSGVP